MVAQVLLMNLNPTQTKAQKPCSIMVITPVYCMKAAPLPTQMVQKAESPPAQVSLTPWQVEEWGWLEAFWKTGMKLSARLLTVDLLLSMKMTLYRRIFYLPMR